MPIPSSIEFDSDGDLTVRLAELTAQIACRENITDPNDLMERAAQEAELWALGERPDTADMLRELARLMRNRATSNFWKAKRKGGSRVKGVLSRA